MKTKLLFFFFFYLRERLRKVTFPSLSTWVLRRVDMVRGKNLKTTDLVTQLERDDSRTMIPFLSQSSKSAAVE